MGQSVDKLITRLSTIMFDSSSYSAIELGQEMCH